ncbi:MAG: hypothetical protein KAS29_08685, partial [Bacteroidales bacterium]|nr:hypothetical protein [Bacteroidales bacterium]
MKNSMRLRRYFNIILMLVTLMWTSEMQAQVKKGVYDKMRGGGAPDPQLSQKDNNYLDRQAKVFLDTVQ